MTDKEPNDREMPSEESQLGWFLDCCAVSLDDWPDVSVSKDALNSLPEGLRGKAMSEFGRFREQLQMVEKSELSLEDLPGHVRHAIESAMEVRDPKKLAEAFRNHIEYGPPQIR